MAASVQEVSADIDRLAIAGARRELVFILDDVPDIDTLVRAMGARREVVIVDAGADGLAAIAAAVAGRSGIDAVHIVSHGGQGRIALGSTILDAHRLDAHQEQLQAIARSLADDADILLYGCGAGAGSAGLALVQGLAGATGADVAASNDASGAAALGADWDLEIRSGAIDQAALPDPALAALYQQVLAIASSTVHFGSDGNFANFGGNTGAQNDVVYRVAGQAGYELRIDGATRNVASYEYSDYLVIDSMDGSTGETALSFSFDNGQLFTPTSIKVTNYVYGRGAQQLIFRGYDSKGNPVGTAQTASTVAPDVSYVTVGFTGLTDIATLRLTADPSSNGGKLVYLAFDDFTMTDIKAAVTAPTVAAVSAANLDGAYGVGVEILVAVRFSEAITVAGGQPTLQLETGDSDRLALYDSGSGSDTLVFKYTVQAGDLAGDLDYLDTGALSAAGATIAAVSGGASASLLLPAPGSPSSLAGSKAIVIDTVAPTAPAQPVLDPASDSGSSNADGITNVRSPTFTGAAGSVEGGARVLLYDTDGTTEIGSTTAALDGSWSATVGVQLTEGSHSVSARAVDAAGNASAASAARQFTIDATLPLTAVLDVALSDDSGIAGDFVTAASLQTISGKLGAPLAADERVELSIDGGATFSALGAAAGATDWSAPALLEASNTLQVRVVDGAGNSGSVFSQAYVIDGSAPDAPSTPDLLAASDSGASDSDNLTGVTAPTFSGIAEAAAGVTLYADGKAVGSAAADAQGKWSITVDPALAGGSYAFTAKASDLAGNTSAASQALAVTIITDVPTAVGATLTLKPDTNLPEDRITNVAAQQLQGTISSVLAPGEQVQVWVGGAWQVAEAVTGSASWSLKAMLAEGPQDLKVRVANAIGNTGPEQAFATTLDTVAPTVAIGSNLAGLKIGEAATITFTFSEDPGASFAHDGKEGDIAVGGGLLSALSGSGAVRTASFTPSAGVDAGKGAITIGAAAFTDLAGNGNATTASFSLAYDTLAPANAPSVPALAVASDSGAVGDGRTNSTTPVFEGKASAAARVVLYDGATLLGTVTAGVEGGWSYAATLALGNHSITALELDAAGNPSPRSEVFALTVEGSGEPPAPQPDPVVDGVPVRNGTVTLPGGVPGTSVAVPIVTPGRSETSGQPGLADIPLQSSNGQTTLLAQVPVGYGLAASGASVAAGGALELLLASIRAATPGHAPGDQGHLVGNGTAFLANLAFGQLQVNTIAPVSNPGSTGALVVTAAPVQGDAKTALVIDTAGLAAGSSLELVAVDFAAIVGAATIASRGAASVLSGDAASQNFTVAASDRASVFSGGGNDSLGFGVPIAAVSALGGERALALPAGGVTTLHGGLALDQAVFAGARADYQVGFENGHVLVSSLAAPQDTALLVNVEQLRFDDGVLAVENDADLTTLAGIYRNALERQADLGGFAFWADHRDAGVGWGVIALQIIDSAERLQSNAGFTGDAAGDIGLLYQALFDRAADAGGLAYWQGMMADGASLEQVATAFVASAEMVGQQRAAVDWDFFV